MHYGAGGPAQTNGPWRFHNPHPKRKPKRTALASPSACQWRRPSNRHRDLSACWKLFHRPERPPASYNRQVALLSNQRPWRPI